MAPIRSELHVDGVCVVEASIHAITCNESREQSLLLYTVVLPSVHAGILIK